MDDTNQIFTYMMKLKNNNWFNKTEQDQKKAKFIHAQTYYTVEPSEPKYANGKSNHKKNQLNNEKEENKHSANG